MISVPWSFNLSSFFFLHLHTAISIQRIRNDHIKSTNSLKSFARILQQALLKCIISLHALYISRGSVWFGNGFHSVSINIQLLFVKGMYNPLKYIFGTSHSHLGLVQEYSWCHLGQDNKNLSQRSQKLCFHIPCSFIALYKWGWFMNVLQFRASGSSRTASSDCIKRRELRQLWRCHSNEHPKCAGSWLLTAQQPETPPILKQQGKFPALSG